MANLTELRNDPVITELMELVAKVRNGEVISMTVITTNKAGEITAKKIVEPSLLKMRYWA
jgi:hypothetical protein